jgi:hypothetical protein
MKYLRLFKAMMWTGAAMLGTTGVSIAVLAVYAHVH